MRNNWFENFDVNNSAPRVPVNPRNINLTIPPCTDLGAALTLANSEMWQQRSFFKNNGVSSYRPWVILMTDGGPNDEWERPAAEMRALAEKGKIIYLGLEIGGRSRPGKLKGGTSAA